MLAEVVRSMQLHLWCALIAEDKWLSEMCGAIQAIWDFIHKEHSSRSNNHFPCKKRSPCTRSLSARQGKKMQPLNWVKWHFLCTVYCYAWAKTSYLLFTYPLNPINLDKISILMMQVCLLPGNVSPHFPFGESLSFILESSMPYPVISKV